MAQVNLVSREFAEGYYEVRVLTILCASRKKCEVSVDSKMPRNLVITDSAVNKKLFDTRKLFCSRELTARLLINNQFILLRLSKPKAPRKTGPCSGSSHGKRYIRHRRNGHGPLAALRFRSFERKVDERCLCNAHASHDSLLVKTIHPI